MNGQPTLQTPQPYLQLPSPVIVQDLVQSQTKIPYLSLIQVEQVLLALTLTFLLLSLLVKIMRLPVLPKVFSLLGIFLLSLLISTLLIGYMI